MIGELLLSLISLVLRTVFSFINLPAFPQQLQTSISTYMDLIFNNIGFLGFFIRSSTLSIVATTAITVISFHRLYKIALWIWNKLPISSN